MGNYAEELAYWYLRLNGFFPLPNLVTHRWSAVDDALDWEDLAHSADADLVALRAPFVTEPVGGMLDDWDTRFEDQWQIPLSTAHVGLIVEVKSGDCREIKGNQESRISYCVGRLGLIRQHEVPAAAERLLHAPSIQEEGEWCIAKLLIGAKKQARQQAQAQKWHYLPLADADRFIRQRMSAYREKARDRLFFPSHLIQYLAAGYPPRGEP